MSDLTAMLTRGTETIPRAVAVGSRPVPTFGRSMERIVFKDELGGHRDAQLVDAAQLPFEEALPIRVPRSYREKRGLVGQAFLSTTLRDVVFDSRLEMENALRLDFDPSVRGLSGQPFRFETEDWRHVPDFFARLSDGSGCVYDVKPVEEQDSEHNQLVFERTEALCTSIGWSYSVLGEIEEPFRTNLLLLAGFRRPPFDPGSLTEAVLDRCAEPTSLAALDELHLVAALVRPIVLHLIWRKVLHCEIHDALLGRESIVQLTEERV